MKKVVTATFIDGTEARITRHLITLKQGDKSIDLAFKPWLELCQLADAAVWPFRDEDFDELEAVWGDEA